MTVLADLSGLPSVDIFVWEDPAQNSLVAPASALCPLKELDSHKAKKPLVLPGGQEDLLLFDTPPPYAPLPREPMAPSPDSTQGDSTQGERGEEPPARTTPMGARLRLRRGGGSEGGQWEAQAFPLRSVGNQMQYWPFSASDLYNWKTHNPPFSQDPQALTGLIESILLTHQPTWDDCQQLLQALLTTEERQRVLTEARKNVPGDNGQPTQLPNEIDAAFPLTRPDWDFSTAAGRERLRLYRQILLTGLRGAGRRPTNLAKYVDDLLLAAETEEDCKQGTESLLQKLGELGYRASAKKAQICARQVVYLGYKLRGGRRWLTEGRKQAVALIPPPKNPRQLREFLGSAGFCRLWIPGFAEIAASLYPLTKNNSPYIWGEEQQLAFDQLKKALLEAPALSLPDPNKPFILYIDERRGIAKGVLTQKLGPWKRPVAYFSKKLDSVASGWPPCLRMIAAVATIVKDSDKLTLGQPLTVVTSHAIETVIRQPPDRWLSNARITHYQAMLLNPERIRFGTTASLNPATLLPEPGDHTQVSHNCQQVLAEVYGAREDLTDQPLPDAEYTWYTDGSSFLHQGERRAGAAVVDGKTVVWASALPPGTSAQKAELVALTEALKQAKGKRVNIYTDSRYAFATAHVHGEIYKRRGLLTSAGREIKNKQEILDLLQALFLPKKVSIIHCPGHQKGEDPVAQGNRMADEVARTSALGSCALNINVQDSPSQGPEWNYTEQDEASIQRLGGIYDETTKSWKIQGKVVLPTKETRRLVQDLHRWTHLGYKKLKTLLDREEISYFLLGLPAAVKQTVEACIPCAKVNPRCSKIPEGVRIRGARPGINWEIDFTEVRPGRYGIKYLLVFVDTFSGWPEAFPVKKETAQVVVKKLLEEIFPRFGLPKVLGSDNGPAFVSRVSQLVTKVLGIDWKLHCAYRPQSSGQVERMNRTLKETLTKLTMETGTRDWVELLPMALFRARNTPSVCGLTPYEILYGGPPPAADLLGPSIDSFATSSTLQTRFRALQLIHRQIGEQLTAVYQSKCPTLPHSFQIGDIVYVRRHQIKTLEPRWKGPYTVLLTTPTAIKVDGIAAWIHVSHVKRATAEQRQETDDPADEPTPTWKLQRTQNPLKIRISKSV
ncbi:uncharacterized protein LOC133764883 [Lepus europaeus]|uniref:uncharacterized protein LOC133764883 n=1 Tax=Lepus europaeus TaxID=9983 RepID=UPI002B48F217|nr:uncharacterized protein LOC133764883 [Lepus europaeus]